MRKITQDEKQTILTIKATKEALSRQIAGIKDIRKQATYAGIEQFKVRAQ